MKDGLRRAITLMNVVSSEEIMLMDGKKPRYGLGTMRMEVDRTLVLKAHMDTENLKTHD
jgi:hypothetical protein